MEGVDYKITYKNHTKVSTEKACAYATLTGIGNFTGTLKGNGKINVVPTKKGIASELNYWINTKDMSSSDITILVKGITKKKGVVKSVSFTLYDEGKKISTKDYTSTITENDGTVTLEITGKGTNYRNAKIVTMKSDLVKASDKKNVIVTYKNPNAMYYYSGSSNEPELIICDKNGENITDKFDITYGENIKVGKGTITIKGKLDEGYCDTRTINFTILPKWMQWFF